jgi:class 3 adenylate cyclase
VASSRQPIRYEQERRYAMSVAEAWRILADTDHLNRAIGLPAVTFSPLRGGSDPLVREARARAYGVVPLRWREFPFDWIRERRYAVRREFENGPLDALVVGMELEPAADGVLVRAFAHFTAKYATGPFLRRLVRPPVAGLLEFCDVYLTRKAAGKADPAPLPPGRPEVDEALLGQLVAELGRAPVEPGLVPLLRERIVEGSDDQLTSVRPFALADVWHADRLDVLRLFLHATTTGLFDLRWELMCPNCRIPKADVGTLRDLPPQFHCDTCGISYAADVDERVELRFSVNPAVRSVTAETYCIGGPLRMPHVVAQQYLAAHEDRRLDLDLAQPLLLRTIGGAEQLGLVGAPASSRVTEVRLTYAAGRWVGPHSLLEDGTLRVPDGAAVDLRNQTDGAVLAVLEDAEWTRDATTASQASSLQEFRELFSSQLLRPGRHLTVRHIALLFTALDQSTRLYDELGDVAAYALISRHFDFLREHVAAAGGTVVKTIGDETMCAFHRLDDAAAAAVAIQQRLGPWLLEQGIEQRLALKLGLHHGPVITAAANDRLDYLGRTANVAATLRAESRGGDLVLLPETLDQLPALRERTELGIEPFTAPLRALGDPQARLVRVRIDGDVEPAAAPAAASD